MLRGRIAVFATALILQTAATSAQVATGRVVDSNGAPVRGAFVQLVRPGGEQAAAVLTGVNGEFVIRAQPGRYALLADLIGHQRAQIDAFDLAAAETRTFTLRLQQTAFKLQALSVTASRRCSLRPESAEATAAVWKEAAKALEVSRWVESGGAGVFRIRHYEQVLDRDLQPTTKPTMRFQSAPGTRAFYAQEPDTLSRYGFVRTQNNDRILYGPDAEVLLSSVFLNDHCFWLERSDEHPGLIGLAFEPVPGRRIAEIKGVLWLDEATSALRFIEYGYANVENYGDRRYAGGRTEFEHLPSGAWIIRKWHVRGPRLARTIRGELRITGAIETGAEVLDVSVASQRTTEFVRRFAVTGIVYDSIRSAPLANAEVYLSGTQFSASTDEKGSFSIADVPQGNYYIAFGHPRLDSLPEHPAPAPLTVDASTAPVQLAVASARTVAERWCPAEERARIRELTFDTTTTNRGLIYGKVRTDNGPADHAVVTVKWQRLMMPTPYIKDALVKPVILEIDTDAAGRFSFCGTPINHPLSIQVSYNRRRVIDSDVRLGYIGLMYREYLFSGGQ